MWNFYTPMQSAAQMLCTLDWNEIHYMKLSCLVFHKYRYELCGTFTRQCNRSLKCFAAWTEMKNTTWNYLALIRLTFTGQYNQATAKIWKIQNTKSNYKISKYMKSSCSYQVDCWGSMQWGGCKKSKYPNTKYKGKK